MCKNKCVRNLFLFTTVQNYKNRLRLSKVMVTDALPPCLWFTVYSVLIWNIASLFQ